MGAYGYGLPYAGHHAVPHAYTVSAPAVTHTVPAVAYTHPVAAYGYGHHAGVYGYPHTTDVPAIMVDTTAVDMEAMVDTTAVDMEAMEATMEAMEVTDGANRH